MCHRVPPAAGRRSPFRVPRLARTAAALVVATTTTILGPGLDPGLGPGLGAVPVARAQEAPVSLVRLPFPQDDGSLTPYTFELGYQLMTLVYDTLLWRDADGVPQPWLAEAVETSDGGRRLTLRLAEGVRWHDGAPLTAADVAFTFSFVADHPHPRFTPQLDAVEEVTALDDRTVRIDLARPSPGFADQPLSDLPILPAHLWADLADGERAPPGLPVGSGPYRLVEHRPGEAYAFEATPDYFRTRPAVERIEVPVINRAEDTLRALERRAVDMLPVSLPDLASLRVDDLGIRVVEGPLFVGTALVLNTDEPPFDRPETRRAVAAALDLTRLTRAVGEAVPAESGYLHPESRWAPPEPLHHHDEAGAATVLGPLDAAPLAIAVADNDPVKLEAARQVALALTRAGWEAEARPLPPDELAAALGGAGSAPSFAAAIEVIPPLASHDPDFLRLLFGSDPRRAPFNLSGYASEEFDALAERVAATPDPGERQAAVTDALRLLATDAPVIPLFFATGAYAYRPAIYDGWGFVKGTGILDKRSFLEPRPTTAPPAGGLTSEGADDDLPLVPLALGALGAAALLAVVGLAGRRRGR